LVTTVTMSEQTEFGPKMRALTDKQRAFVMALVEFPGISGKEAAIMAGYSDSSEAAKVTASKLRSDQRIVAAIQEQAGKRLWAISLKAAGRIEQLIDSPDDAVALKACAAVLDRTGLAAQQNININQTVRDESGKAIMERIRALAAKHGLDEGRLLGKPAPAVVDAEFSEVKDG
jgi:phage terminase small subunit